MTALNTAKSLTGMAHFQINSALKNERSTGIVSGRLSKLSREFNAQFNANVPSNRPSVKEKNSFFANMVVMQPLSNRDTISAQ